LNGRYRGSRAHPAGRDIARATFSRDAGDVDSALHYAEQLARFAPAPGCSPRWSMRCDDRAWRLADR